MTIEKCLLTHWHHDHILGVPDLLSLCPSAEIYKCKKHETPHDDWPNIEDGQTFETEGARLRAFHCPGHTTDHMAFILEEEDAMFTGDNVLGQGTAVYEDYAAYMNSLQAMSKQFAGRGYPGHGPVIDDGKALILEYIEHRKERERQVLNVMGSKSKDWTSMEMVKVIYKDYPESLHAPAEGGVKLILDKLLKEDKVAFDVGSQKWSLRKGAAL